jgi:hypothetical protein
MSRSVFGAVPLPISGKASADDPLVAAMRLRSKKTHVAVLTIGSLDDLFETAFSAVCGDDSEV